MRLVLSACIVLAWAAPATAFAETYRPTRFDDPSPGACKPNDCSLTEAINATTVNGGHDRIVLKSGTYEREVLGSPSAGGPGGLDIEGKGPDETIVDANGMGAPFSLASTSGSSSIESLTVTGGSLSTGGGVNVLSNHVALRDVDIIGNSATEGGGVYLDRTVRDVKLLGLRITGNEATFGGGLRSMGRDVIIKKTTIAANNAGEGGGIDLRPAMPGRPATMAIRSSTISGNFAVKGGGILADGQPTFDPEQKPPKAALLNSTVAGNSASGDGGGILVNHGAKLTLASSTLAYNAADDDGTGGGDGGGIWQQSSLRVALLDSLVGANVVGASGASPQCAGSFAVNAGTVLQTQAVTCDVSGSPVLTANPLVGLLADNGGPTQTVELLSGSAAIANAVGCPKRDQRGVKRPDSGCDSGSFERKLP